MIRAILGLAVAVLVVSGCSAAAPTSGTGGDDGGGAESASPSASGGEGGGGGTKPDPCTLLAPADLETVFGVEFQPGVLVGTTTAATVQCQWPKQGGFTASLILAIDDIGSAGFGCIGDVRTVSGVGDEACFGFGGLHVRHGAWDLVFLGVEGMTDQQLTDVAKVAVSRL